MDQLSAYKKAIQQVLGSETRIFLFWKGRVALYCILRSLDIGKGDEVIIPGFTCVVVPNAVIYTGATPIYADVDPETYTVTADTMRSLITPNTKAIIAQNTYGLSADLDPILELAKEHDLEVIDDCTHGFGGEYKGALNGTRTRAAFFSTQWNKPYSTGLGGFAVTADLELAKKLKAFENKADAPSSKEVLSLRVMHFAREYLLTDTTYWTLVRLYRWLSTRNLVTGSSQGEELESPKMPEGFLKGHSGLQAAVGANKVADWSGDNAFRAKVANEYTEVLNTIGKKVPYQPEYAKHGFLKYPVMVKDRDMFRKRAELARIRLGDWFISPLHPIEGDLSAWQYQFGSCPNAEYLAKHVVNLPTDTDMKPKEIERVINFLKDEADLII